MIFRITADYHTHTQFSHGKGSPEDNVVAARSLGLKRIAITDHGYGHVGYGIRQSDLPLMSEKIFQLRQRYPDIEILLGVEANILNPEGELDIEDDDLKYIDILLAGYHFGSVPVPFGGGIAFHSVNLLNRWGLFSDRALEWNTQAACNAMERYPIRILTHPGAKGPIDVARIARKAAEKDVWLEINSSHGYLTTEQIRQAHKWGARFVIDSDAHRPSDVGRCEEGILRAIAAGLTEENVVNMERVEL